MPEVVHMRAEQYAAGSKPVERRGVFASERVIRTVAAASLVLSLGYIVWRWGWTLNPDALWFSVSLALAETYGLITAFFMTVTAWRLLERTPPRAPPGLAVDVFVTTYDEPLNTIRKTVLAAREIRYPHKTWILDDGKREEIRALSEELGIGYLRRKGNAHAKAGNLNHALSQTEGEFILQLDADHVPQPQILDRMLGFFADEKLAFVQSPQDFYNTDAFTYEVNERARHIWEDQQLFFRVLQPGKDRLGAAFFVGSCAVIRRRALEEIGGFATATITEDIETSMLLHAHGWRSAFLNETLAYGLAPGSAQAFHVQHLRWGQGAMQALKRYRPLTMKGLTVWQRIGYLDSLTTYLGGFQRLVFYLAPVVFFLTGHFPLQASAAAFSAIFIPYFGMQLLSFKLLARGHGSLLLADRYAMAKFFTHILSITGFLRRQLRFRVTPKGLSNVPLRTYAPQLGLIALTLFAITWSLTTQVLYPDAYDVAGWGALAFWVNLAFAAWTVTTASYIVRMSIRMKQKRADHRFAETMPAEVVVRRRDGRLVARTVGVTDNLNPYGIALRTMYCMPEDARVELTLPLATGVVVPLGRVVHRRESRTEMGTVHTFGIEFEDLDWETRDAIELHCAHHATPLERQRYTETASTLESGLRRIREFGRSARVQLDVPARVFVGSRETSRDIGFGVLEHLTPDRAFVLLEHPLASQSRVRIQIPDTDVVLFGQARTVRALETSMGMRFLVSVARMPEHHDPPSSTAAAPLGMPQPSVTLPLVRRHTPLVLAAAAEEIFAAVAAVAEAAAVPANAVAPVAAAAAPAEPPPVPAAPVLTSHHTRPVNVARPPRVVARAITHTHNAGVARMSQQQQQQPQNQQQQQARAKAAAAYTPIAIPDALPTMAGPATRLAGTFHIEDAVAIDCELKGELVVGRLLVIGDTGQVQANVSTTDAVILGSYTGDLVATGRVEIAAGAQVSGSIESASLQMEHGATLNATVRRRIPSQAENSAPQPSRAVAAAAADERRNVTPIIAEPVADDNAQNGPSAQLEAREISVENAANGSHLVAKPVAAQDRKWY